MIELFKKKPSVHYIIEDIQFRATGETRTDWKYPERIGSTIEFVSSLQVSKPLYFQYINYKDGSESAGDHITRTSTVDDYDFYSHPEHLYIYTKNSIYILKEIN